MSVSFPSGRLRALRALSAALAAAALARDGAAADAGACSARDVRIRWGGSELGRCVREPTVAVTEHGAELAPVDYLVETRGNRLHGGVNGGTRFGDGRQGRKRFSLDRVDADRAEIFLFSPPTGDATFNGLPLLFTNFPHHGGWCVAGVEGSRLRAGTNDLVFRSGFRLSQDAETAPAAHSEESSDSGLSWCSATGGEWMVHLRLHRHPPAGVLESPALDLADPAGDRPLGPALRPTRLRFRAEADSPRGTSVSLEARSGPTPWPDARWSAWSPPSCVPPERFAQWRATLATRHGRRTPRLRAVTVEAQAVVAADPAPLGFTLVASRNPPLPRGSHAYGVQRPSDSLRRLRELYALDQVVAAGATDWDRLVRLRNWVRRRWPCNDAGSGVRTWNALEILGAPEGQHGMCVHFAAAFTQCALALGYNARPVILTGHFVADVWSPQHGKWILMDVEAVHPEGFRKYGTAHYLDARTREPLDVLDLHRAVRRAEAEGRPRVDDVIQVYSADTERGPHEVREVVRTPAELGIFRSFAYPPRNDHLDRPEPWEVAHGENHYHSNDYLWWDEGGMPSRDAQYSRRTGREADIRWTVHRVRLAAVPDDHTPGTLAVTAETVTPNLRAVRFHASGAPPVEVPAGDLNPDWGGARFTWRLRQGRNRLDACAVNAFGASGEVSFLDVDWTPPPAAP